MGDCKNNLIDEVKEGDEVRGSFKDEATGKTYYTTGKVITNPKTKKSFIEDETGGITPIEDFFFLINIKNDPHEVSTVKCDLCTKEWVAVRPEGLKQLQCPNCGNMVHFENV